MIGYILTLEQKESIQGKEYAPYQIFNCVLDINGIWFIFLTDDDLIKIQDTEFSWIADCQLENYIQPIVIF